MNSKTLKLERTTLFLFLITVYIVTFSFSAFLQSGVLKLLVNVEAIFIFFIMLVNWLFLPTAQQNSKRLSCVIALTLFYVGLIGSFIFNLGKVDYIDFIKMVITPMFFLFGMTFESNRDSVLWNNSRVKLMFLILLLLPLMSWMVQILIGATSYGSNQQVAFFPNRNVASLYAVSLIALYNLLSEDPLKNIYVYFLVAFMFGAMGVLLAILLSMLITLGRMTTLKYIASVALFFVALLMLFPKFVIFSRVHAVIDSINLIVNGGVNLLNVSYATFGRLVNELGTTDLSFIFRLKHWLELLYFYSSGTVEHLLFGYGVGSTTSMTVSHLIPHNDYLRILLESGLIAFCGFLSMVILIIYKTWRRWEAIPLLAICMYFFSENLINSFASMAIFYFTAGAIIQRIESNRT